MRVLVFGDSITWGGNDSQGGWVDRVKRKFLESDHPARIINLGIGGDTSDCLHERLEPNIYSARISTKGLAIVFSVGVNDSRLIVKGDKPQTDIATYEKNLRKSVTLLKKYSDKILFVGLTTLHPDHSSVYVKGFVYKRELIAAYNKVLHTVADDSGIPIIDVTTKIEERPEMFFRDNLHLSDEGHKVLAETILPEIEKLLQ